MEGLEALARYWPILISILGLVVWLVRLEGRIGQVAHDNTETQKDIDNLRVRHESLDSKIVQQLSEVRESLARLEGALGIKK